MGKDKALEKYSQRVSEERMMRMQAVRACECV